MYELCSCKNAGEKRDMIKGNESAVGILILSYRLKEVINSHVFELHIIVHISATKCLIVMGFEPNCSILNGKEIYFEKL